MKNFESILISPNTNLREAISKIDTAKTKMVLVVDSDRKLLGTLSDGDIRRALLAGIEIHEPVEKFMCRTPTIALANESKDSVIRKMRTRVLHQIPIIDENGRAVDLKLMDDYVMIQERDNWVVIMAGGPGSRLKELTIETPKPMLKVGNRPLLETMVSRLVEQGFSKIWLAVHYHAGKIRNHFGDGAKFGAEINYIVERKRLGTAGAISMLPEIPSNPILVTNADLLANVDYCELLDEHVSAKAAGTMAVREFEYQIPYGVVMIENGSISRFREKPVHKVMVNAGIYVLSPEAIPRIPAQTFFDMPELFENMIAEGYKTHCHRLRCYWIDIGKYEDFCKANLDFPEVFS